MMQPLEWAKMPGHHVPHDEQTSLPRGRISPRSVPSGTTPWYCHPFNIIGLVIVSAIVILILACAVRSCLQSRNRHRNRACLLRCGECKHCRNHIDELGRRAVWPTCPATITTTSDRLAMEKIPTSTTLVVGWMLEDRPLVQKCLERGQEAWWKGSKSNATDGDERCKLAQLPADEEMRSSPSRRLFFFNTDEGILGKLVSV